MAKLLEDGDSEVRSVAVEALGRLGEPAAPFAANSTPVDAKKS